MSTNLQQVTRLRIDATIHWNIATIEIVDFEDDQTIGYCDFNLKDVTFREEYITQAIRMIYTLTKSTGAKPCTFASMEALYLVISMTNYICSGQSVDN